MEPQQQLSQLQTTLLKVATNVGMFFRNHKKWSYFLIALVCLIIVGYIAGAYLLDPRDKVEAFEKAVHNGDVKTLKNLVNSEESSLTIDDKHLQQLITYSRENKDYLSKQVDHMNTQISMEEAGFSDTSNNSDFYLKKTSIPLFYSFYSIEVRPYFIDLSTNEADATIKLDGKTVFKTTSSEQKHTVGPLMPGYYKTYAEKKYEYALLSQENTISAFDEEDATAESDLQLYGGNLKLEGNFPDTTIFINGKAIGQQLKDMPEIGPVSFNGTIRVHGERKFPWGLEKSPDAVIEKDTSSVDITPVPFADEKSRKTIVDTINKFSKEEIQALIKHDANQFTTLDDNYKKVFIEQINNDVQAGDTWKGQALDTRIDFDNIELSQDENTAIYTSTVPIEIHAKYKKYDSYGFNKDEPLDDKVDSYFLKLTYNEKSKKWLISGRDDLYYDKSEYFNGKNVVKSVFK